MSRGEYPEARRLCGEALKRTPKHFDALQVLGWTEHLAGDDIQAARVLERAVEVNPGDVNAQNNLGTVYSDLGILGRAFECFDRALELEPRHHQTLNNLGIARARAGLVDEAIDAFHRVVSIDPEQAGAHFNLCALVYDDQDLRQATEVLGEALRADPGYGKAIFHMAVLAAQLGDTEGAMMFLQRVPLDLTSYIDSWGYVCDHAEGARFFGTTWDTLEFALGACEVDGLTLEFGVRYGWTLRFIAKHSGPRQVHGFDSFQGLPESWRDIKKGSYSTEGKLPPVPDRVTLHVGWFDEALPGFCEDHDGPVRLLHVDCDLYRSTATIFEHLGDRIVSGTVIVFDEYLMNNGWREDEFKAFQEAVERYSWKYEYLAFNLFSKQAVVRIL